MFPSELPLHHCVAAPDTAFVLEDTLAGTRSGFTDGDGGTQTSRELLWPGRGNGWQRGQVAAPAGVQLLAQKLVSRSSKLRSDFHPPAVSSV